MRFSNTAFYVCLIKLSRNWGHFTVTALVLRNVLYKKLKSVQYFAVLENWPQYWDNFLGKL